MTSDKKGENPCEPEAAAEEAADAVQPGADAAGASDPSPWGDGEVADLKAENAELKDQLLRTLAELENVRRRAEREREDTRKYAMASFARDMLNVSDNMTRALSSLDEAAREKADDVVKAMIEGVDITYRELLKVFHRHGIEPLDPQGERFDPNFHQAMFEVENPDVAAGTVVQVVQQGYRIGERVLRPAMVGVSKGGPKAPPAPTPEAETPPETANESDPPADAASGEADKATAAARSHQDAAGAKDGEDPGKTVDRSA